MLCLIRFIVVSWLILRFFLFIFQSSLYPFHRFFNFSLIMCRLSIPPCRLGPVHISTLSHNAVHLVQGCQSASESTEEAPRVADEVHTASRQKYPLVAKPVGQIWNLEWVVRHTTLTAKELMVVCSSADCIRQCLSAFSFAKRYL